MNLAKFTTALQPFVKSDEITITTTYLDGHITGFVAYMRARGRKEFKVKGPGEEEMKKAWKEMEKWAGVIKPVQKTNQTK